MIFAPQSLSYLRLHVASNLVKSLLFLIDSQSWLCRIPELWDSGIVSNTAARKAFVRDEVRNEVQTLIEVSINVGVHSQDVAIAAAQLLREADTLHAQLKKYPLGAANIIQ